MSHEKQGKKRKHDCFGFFFDSFKVASAQGTRMDSRQFTNGENGENGVRAVVRDGIICFIAIIVTAIVTAFMAAFNVDFGSMAVGFSIIGYTFVLLLALRQIYDFIPVKESEKKGKSVLLYILAYCVLAAFMFNAFRSIVFSVSTTGPDIPTHGHGLYASLYLLAIIIGASLFLIVINCWNES